MKKELQLPPVYLADLSWWQPELRQKGKHRLAGKIHSAAFEEKKKKGTVFSLYALNGFQNNKLLNKGSGLTT